jgi:hypothetical protein
MNIGGALTTVALIVALSGCEQATKAADDVARRSAKAAVGQTLATRFPTVPNKFVTPFTDCVIDNSTGREIAEFAKDAVIGVDETTAVLVRNVLARPETQQCVAKAGLAALAA